MSHRYGIFSWWWAHSCPKYVEKSNKHIKKICAPSWFYLQKTLDCFTPGKISWYSLSTGPNRPRNRSKAFWEEVNLLTIPGIEPKFLDCQARSPLTVPTELAQVPATVKLPQDDTGHKACFRSPELTETLPFLYLDAVQMHVLKVRPKRPRGK